jgi:imidazolonepropionase-like amidohydrolase
MHPPNGVGQAKCVMAAPDAIHLRGVVLPGSEVRDVYVAGGKITFDPVEARTVLEDCVLLPGLVDAHAHLGLATPAPGDVPAARTRASARAQLAAGVLCVREPGGTDRASAAIGPAEGLPRTVSGGRFLAPPGGYIPGRAREVPADALADAAEDEAGASAAWSKVIGDFVVDGAMTLNYPPEVLTEAVERVHRAGGRVAVHAMGCEAIEAALAARVDSIEHGIAARADHVQVMRERGVAWVPTLMIRDGIPEFLRSFGMTAASVERWRATLRRQGDVVREAADAGVTVLAGTDAGMVPHGRIHREVRRLLDAGVRPDAALGAASWIARDWLGLPALEQGAPADIVAYRTDPRDDASALAFPALVVLAGRIVDRAGG